MILTHERNKISFVMTSHKILSMYRYTPNFQYNNSIYVITYLGYNTSIIMISNKNSNQQRIVNNLHKADNTQR
jgi:hypothetical protein